MAPAKGTAKSAVSKSLPKKTPIEKKSALKKKKTTMKTKSEMKTKSAVKTKSAMNTKSTVKTKSIPKTKPAPADRPAKKTNLKRKLTKPVAEEQKPEQEKPDQEKPEEEKPEQEKTKRMKKKRNSDAGNIALELAEQAEFEAAMLELSSEDCKPGTLYIGHIPHGFFEEQIRGYFTQFGTVSKVRLARSKKTGRCKGYGFIQFVSDEVAEIAAEAMHGYLMFDKILQCKVMSAEQQHRQLWKGAKRRFVFKNRASLDIKLQQRNRSDEQKRKVLQRLSEKQRKREKKLKSLGIDYKLPMASVPTFKTVREGKVEKIKPSAANIKTANKKTANKKTAKKSAK